MKKLSDIPNIDKPREKLASRGIQALSSHELIIVLLGSGSIGRDVSTLEKDIYHFHFLSPSSYIVFFDHLRNGKLLEDKFTSELELLLCAEEEQI